MTRKEFARIYRQLPMILNPERYIKLAQATQFINYDCRIGKKGCCKAYQTDNSCCCNLCNRSRGYLHYRFEDKSIMEEIINLFNDKTGFWKSGKGCILPRKYRSGACLYASCSPDIHTLLKLKKIYARLLLYCTRKESQKS